MPEPILEPFSPENTTILMVDYSVGFMNMFRSHDLNEHLRATVALAKTGLGFKSGFVVNLGAGQKPYPQLAEALGDHPIIYRGGEYNALGQPRGGEGHRGHRKATSCDRRHLHRWLCHRNGLRGTAQGLHRGARRRRYRG